MKITSITAGRYLVPISMPVTEKEVLHEAVLVMVETDDGISGHGIAGLNLNESVVEFVNVKAGPFLVGADPLRFEDVWYKLYRTFNSRSLTGVWSLATSAIDIALWDIRGKHLGQSISQLLGGYATRMPAYVTFGVLDYTRDELAEVATMLAKSGHRMLKMVAGIDGAKNVKEDAARVEVVRNAIGPDVDLIVDVNYLFDFVQAREFSHRIGHCGIHWIEDPIRGNDYRLLADLRRQITIPIAAGHWQGHLWHHREAVVNQAIDICLPNVCCVGGYTEGVKVAHLAEAFNLPMANGGGWPYHNVHLQAGLPNGGPVEFHYLAWKLCEMLFEGLPEPKDGWIDVPGKPGLGFEPVAAALEEFRV